MYGIDSAAVPVNVRHELYAVKLLGRSLLSVEVLDVEVLEMGVLCKCILLERLLVYVLGGGA